MDLYERKTMPYWPARYKDETSVDNAAIFVGFPVHMYSQSIDSLYIKGARLFSWICMNEKNMAILAIETR